MARDGKTPKALLSRPELLPGAAPYYYAFMRLHGSRIMGRGPIPVSEIEAYARFFGFDTLDDRTDLYRFVKACDSVWLKIKERTSADAGKQPQSRSRQPRRRARR